MSENAFADLMSDHLRGATVLKDVYYPIGNKQWAETDSVILLDDVLINIEAKAGSEALNAPAENLSAHVKRVEDLVRDAYKQSKRFIDYLHTEPEVPLYELRPDGKYAEVARVRHSDLRKILPIGLTVEAFTPFSASIKERSDVTEIQGKYNFISLAIDDLMVLKRLLRSTGEFLHYLDVRQGLAAMKNVVLFDEIDHLGAYISQNRADLSLQKTMDEHEANHVWVDGMDQDVVGPYFSDPDWPQAPIPAQEYPPKTYELLEALERTVAKRWLEADSFIRDLSGEGRAQFADNYDRAFPILNARPVTYFAIGGEATAVFGLMHFDQDEHRKMITFKAEALALVFDVPKVRLFYLAVRPTKEIYSARMVWVQAPTVLRMDYRQVADEAARLKTKIKPI